MITHEIIGDDMQAVVLTMARGDVVRAEAGAMMYMTDGINMDAKMSGGLTTSGPWAESRRRSSAGKACSSPP